MVRHHNFDIIRLIAAIMVIYSHSFVLSGYPEPGAIVYRNTFGGLGVAIFLMISGYLVSQSWNRSKNLKKYFTARFLRIIPGLSVSVLLCVFVIGPLVTTLSLKDYFFNFQTIDFFRNISMYSLRYALPGVFESNPYPVAVNGSLWTLCYEFTCYTILAIVSVIAHSKLKNLKLSGYFLIIGLIGMVFSGLNNITMFSINLGLFFKLFSCFSIGYVYNEYKDLVIMKFWMFIIAISATSFSLFFGGLNDYGFILFGSYIVFYIGTLERFQLNITSIIGDISYGLYIYAFPVQQTVSFYLGGHQNQLANFIISTAITVIIASISWHLVEKKCLLFKHKNDEYNLNKFGGLHFMVSFFKSRISQISGIFVFAFIIMFVYISGNGSMISSSGDAAETWNVAKTFFSENPATSYVMYKGLWSLIPSIAAYNIETALHLKEFTLYIIMNSLAFAYITSIGIPTMWQFIAQKNMSIYRVVCFAVVSFLLLRHEFTFISVDVPCIVILMLAINLVLKNHNQDRIARSIFTYTLLFVYIALLFSFSGQYAPAGVCLFIYSLGIIFKDLKGIKRLNKLIVFSITSIIGVALIKMPDLWFIAERVTPFREAGGWLPSAKTWFQYALTANMMIVDYPTSIIDVRGTAILLRENVSIEQVAAGGTPITVAQHFQMVLKYPVEFLLRWLNRLFVGITYYSTKSSLTLLVTSYSILYICLKEVYNNCKTYNSIMQKYTLLFLAWILPALVPCLLHVESRYFIGLKFIMLSVVIFIGFKFKWIFIPFSDLNQKTDGEALENNAKGGHHINYNLVIGLMFVLMCLMIFGALRETVRPEHMTFFSI